MQKACISYTTARVSDLNKECLAENILRLTLLLMPTSCKIKTVLLCVALSWCRFISSYTAELTSCVKVEVVILGSRP